MEQMTIAAGFVQVHQSGCLEAEGSFHTGTLIVGHCGAMLDSQAGWACLHMAGQAWQPPRCVACLEMHDPSRHRCCRQHPWLLHKCTRWCGVCMCRCVQGKLEALPMEGATKLLEQAWSVAYKEVGKEGEDKVPTIDMITGEHLTLGTTSHNIGTQRHVTHPGQLLDLDFTQPGAFYNPRKYSCPLLIAPSSQIKPLWSPCGQPVAVANCVLVVLLCGRCLLCVPGGHGAQAEGAACASRGNCGSRGSQEGRHHRQGQERVQQRQVRFCGWRTSQWPR